MAETKHDERLEYYNVCPVYDNSSKRTYLFLTKIQAVGDQKKHHLNQGKKHGVLIIKYQQILGLNMTECV
jgi:hypothetical protein